MDQNPDITSQFPLQADEPSQPSSPPTKPYALTTLLAKLRPLVTQVLLPKIRPVITTIFQRTKSFVTSWKTRFTAATPREKAMMVGKPVFAAVLVWTIVSYGSLLLPPQIMTSFPDADGLEAPLDSTIEIVFDRPVLKASAEKNLSFEPALEGTMSWEGGQKLIFTPQQPLERSKTYTVHVGGTVLSSFGIPMLRSQRISFSTLGHPKVVVMSPEMETLEELSPVTVIFDRPMVPLTTATASAVAQSAFTIVPSIEGEGRWLGTTAYQFRPAKPLKRSSTYTVTVPKGLASQDGGTLQEDVTWQFSSSRPKVTRTSPDTGYQFGSPTASVAAFLSQPIDANSAKEHFKLYDSSGNEVAGSVRTQNDVVGFYPSQPLAREKEYRAVLTSGLKGDEGENGLEEDKEWSFKVAAMPSVLSSSPKDSDTDVEQTNTVFVRFKTPMSEKSLESRVHISPAPEQDPNIYFSSYGGTNELSINSYFGRSTTYTITIDGSATDQYGVPLGRDFSFSFTTAPYQPSVTIYPSGTYFGSFNQQVTPRLVAQVINASAVDYSLFKLSQEDFLDLYQRRYNGKCGSDRNCASWQSYDTSKLQKVRSWRESFDENFNVPVHVVTKVTNEQGQNLEPGYYFIDLDIGNGKHDNMVMIVSQTVLTVKKSDNQLFVWAVDQTTGQVVPDMQITMKHSSGYVIAEGKTNGDGVFQKNVDLDNQKQLFVFGDKNDEHTVVSDTWDSGIDSSDFGLPFHYDENGSQSDTDLKHKLFITLDRPIFRPGQTIHYKGLVRIDNDGAYQTPEQGKNVNVSIVDPQGRKLQTKQLQINSYGSLSDEYTLSEDAQLGTYNVIMQYEGASRSQALQVEEYRKPDVAVSIMPNKSEYVDGETAAIDIQGSYYFGAPVTQTPLTWTVKAQDSSFRWSKDWRFEFGDPDSYWSQPWWQTNGSSYFSGEVVTQGETTTDSSGQVHLSVPLDTSASKGPQRYQVEAVLNDQGNQSIAGSYEMVVHQGSLYAGLRPVRYGSSAGKTTNVEVVSLTSSQQEAPNQPVQIDFYKRTWQTVREQNPDDGRFYNVSKPSDSLVASSQVTTDALARATASFVPEEGGSYRVVSTITDSRGKTNHSSTYLWVSGSNFSAARENNDRIVVVTDKRDYKVGETASVFVATPYASESAKTLLTMERGSVLDYKVVDANETSNNFELPITNHHTPNIFVSALLIRPGSEVKKPAEFKIGYTELMVTDPHNQLDVTIKPEKQRYLPREKMRATIETKDAAGNPVSTELAVSLVDKAVWDLSQVQPADIYQTFYQARRLGVSTSQLLTKSIDRINANTNLGAKGGSGGGGSGEGFDTTRTQFPDTAFWQAHVVTDSQGKASVEIDLPDSLTTWRMAAVAASNQAAFGSSTSEILVSKDVLIRPFMPRFLSAGDESDLGGIIVNTSGQTMDITAKLNTEGLNIADAQPKSYSLADGEQVKVTWRTKAKAADKASVTMTVTNEDGKILDATKLELPLKEYAIPEVTATSGQAQDTATETIALPQELVTDKGSLKLTLSPTLGAGALEGFGYLNSYLYSCTEQTASRFMPAVYLNQILERMSLDSVAGFDREALDAVVNDGLQRLTTQQHNDGGWGWWVEGESNPELTAYAYEALLAADQQGYTVSPQVLERARTFMLRYLGNKPETKGQRDYRTQTDLSARVVMLYALKDSGVNLAGYAQTLYESRFNLTVEQRAKLAIVLRTMPSKRQQANRLFGELLSLGKKTATTTHWEEAKNSYSSFSSTDATTASMLEAIIAFDPRHKLIPEVMRYLLNSRRDGHWTTTRDTAAVIKSVSKHLLATSQGKLDESYKVELDGQTVQEGSFKKDDLFKLQEYSIAVSELGAGSSRQLRMSKSGKGELYYNLDLRYFLPYEEIEPLDQGITVIRELVSSKGVPISSTSIEENTEAWVRLTIVAPADRHYVAIEDILPAGFEAVNESLKNVSTLSTQPLPKSNGDNRSYYFSQKEYHDDRTAMFAEHLPAGVYELSYRVRATTPGRYHYPPAQAYQMYVPDVSGHSAGGWLEVTAR